MITAPALRFLIREELRLHLKPPMYVNKILDRIIERVQGASDRRSGICGAKCFTPYAHATCGRKPGHRGDHKPWVASDGAV